VAIELSKTAKGLSKGINQRPQIVLEIKGLETRYGNGTIKKFIQIGDDGLFIDGTWKIGGYRPIADQEDLISFDGTSSTISQQLLQDKGGTSSISSIQIALLDKDGKATELISPGVKITDVLGVEASVYVGYQDTAFPQDFVEVFSGIIDEASGGSTVILNIAHPEAGKRFDIFQPYQTILTSNANYRSKTIDGVIYRTRRDVVGTVNIIKNTGVTAGNETVNVSGNNITIQIENGVSTASQVRKALNGSNDALNLIEVEIIENGGGTLQHPNASTPLDSDTTINVERTNYFLLPADSGTLRTYIRIDDEIIEYTGKTDTAFTGCTRAALEDKDARARGDFHEADTSVTSFYRLQGNAIDLALKIMLSGEKEYFVEDYKVSAVNEIPGVGTIANALYFVGVNVSDKFGIVPGDFATTQGEVDYPENNITLGVVASVVQTEFGSYIIIDDAGFTTNPSTELTVSFKSKYNVLPPEASLGLGGHQVDVPEFERIKELFSSSIFSYDFYFTELENAKTLIDTDILFPTGCYTLPRKGKVSVGYTSPPLAVSSLPVLSSKNISKPQQNRMVRSINKYFYNNVVFKYNPSPVDNSLFLNGDVDFDADSKAQIKVPNKTLLIEARGLRPSDDNDIIIGVVSTRLLERYRFAAEFIKTQAFYGIGFPVDVGDPVLFGDEDLQLVDTRKGKRGFSKRIFEVVNKSMNIKTGEIAFDLVDTNYLSDGRYGVFSPSTQLDSGSTTTVLKIKNSYATPDYGLEVDKWTNFIGQKIRVHSEDFSYDEETTFIGVDPTNNYKFIVEPALPSAPLEDYIIDLPNYFGTNEDAEPYKTQHCFWDPSVPVASATVDTELDVDPGDIGKFFVGSKVLVHDEEFDIISPEVTVTEIDGNTIKFDLPLGFVPDSTYSLELIGFENDLGPAYRYL
jgi:hypothetical protein